MQLYLIFVAFLVFLSCMWLWCVFLVETFHTNPQYHVAVDEPDENDEDGKSTIIVGVMQKNRRKMRMEGKADLTIGYCIYQVIYTPSFLAIDLYLRSILKEIWTSGFYFDSLAWRKKCNFGFIFKTVKF